MIKNLVLSYAALAVLVACGSQADSGGPSPGPTSADLIAAPESAPLPETCGTTQLEGEPAPAVTPEFEVDPSASPVPAPCAQPGRLVSDEAR